MKEKIIFYISDSTAITATGLGKSLLSQFDRLSFVEHLRPFVNNEEKVLKLVEEIKESSLNAHSDAIIFASMMNEELMNLLASKVKNVIDIFEPFIPRLEALMEKKSSKEVGLAHKISNDIQYKKRIIAIDFAMATDDGLRTSDYEEADIILVGVSRTGKTPTAIYLALQFGLKVANFPFTSEDLPEFSLNLDLIKNKDKIFGLIINENRLHSIRKERRNTGSYADIIQIKKELSALKDLFLREHIPFIDTTNASVEEIASSILSNIKAKK